MRRSRGRQRGAEPFAFELEAGGGIARDSGAPGRDPALFYPYPDEYRSCPPDLELLRTLAEQTRREGWRRAPTRSLRRARPRRLRRALWPWLAAAALLLYLFDIAVRRAPWFRRWLDGA